jgi:hypothetical protein
MTEQDKQALIKHFCSRDCGEAAEGCTIMPCHEIELIQEFPTSEADSDTISRKAAIDALGELITGSTESGYAWFYTDDVYKAIKQLPTIQPEIIRCKDCKYARLTDDGSCKYCDIWFPDEAEYMDGDYYCASAERKSNG